MTNPLVNLIIEVARSQLTPNEQAQIRAALDAGNDDDAPIKAAWRKGDGLDATVDRIECPDGTVLVASDGAYDSCSGCVFGDRKLRHGITCLQIPGCSSYRRTDGRNIIWVKP